MKAKIKRHSRSALSVLLSLCMLVSCMTVGLIATDAAQTLDAIGASADEASVGADLDKAEDGEESVGAAVEDSDSVGGSGVFIQGSASGEMYQASNGDYFYNVSNGGSFNSWTFKVGGTNYGANSSSDGDRDIGAYNSGKTVKAGVNDDFRKQSSISDSNFTVWLNSAKNWTWLTSGTQPLPTKTITLDASGISSYSSTATVAGTTTISASSGTVSGSYTVDSTATVTVLPLSDSTKKPTASLGSTNVPLTFNGTNYTGTFTVPSSNATLSIGARAKGTYDINVAPDDAENGTAQIVSVGGSPITPTSSLTGVAEDAAIGLSATANDGHPFAGWNKGYDKANPNAVYYVDGGDAEAGTIDIKALFKTNYYDVRSKAIVGDTSNIISLDARMFDYYYDSEYKDGWLEYTGSEKGVQEPFKAFNRSLMEYAEKNNVQVPLYFGTLYGKSDGYRGEQTTSDTPSSDKYSTDYRFYWAANDSNGINSIGGSGNDDPLTGLSGLTLEDGTIHHYSSSGGTTQNGVPMALFDKDWLTSRTQGTYSSGNDEYTYGGALATIIDTKFPVVKHMEGQGVNKLCLDVNGKWSNTGYIYAWIWKDDNTGGQWVRLTKSGDYYYADLPADYTHAKFASLEGVPSNLTSYGSATIYYGNNYTKDLTIVQADHSYYELGSWDGNPTFGGSWKTNANANVTVTGGHAYYGFNSLNGTDNAYFTGIHDGSSKDPVMNYKSGSNNSWSIKDEKGAYSFLPFDNDHAGNNGYDYGFGMNMSVEFTLGEYEEGGVTKYGQNSDGTPQIFEFSGDDDLWVFVDDKLILDLGGAHGRTDGKIDFKAGTVTTWDQSNNYNNGVKMHKDSATPADSTHHDVPALSGVTRNSSFTLDNKSKHKLTIYYLERGKIESNLKFGFTFKPVGNELQLENDLNTENVNSALVSDVETIAKANDKFTFTQTWADTASGTFAAIADKKYTFKRGDTEANGITNSSGVVPNVTISGSTVNQFKIDDHAYFIDQYKDEIGKYIKLVETEDAGNKFIYSKSLNVYDLVTHNTRTKESDTVFKYDTTKASPNRDIDATRLRAEYINTVVTQNVSITKAIADTSAGTPGDFTIKVLVQLPGGSQKAYALPYVKSGTSGTLSDAGETTIQNGETITISGIPVGSVVEVTEVSGDGTYQYEFSNVNGVDTYDDVINGQTFTVKNGFNAAVTINNSNIPAPAGKSLKIYKKLTTGSSSFRYEMFIEANGADYSGTYSICNASDDQVVRSRTYDSSTGIAIKTSQYILLENIPVDTEIEVTEAEYKDQPRAYHYAYSKLDDTTIEATTGDTRAIERGIHFTLSDDSTVEVFNKPWTYTIRYEYPAYLARYYGNTAPNQWYWVKGTFTDDDFDDELVVPATETDSELVVRNCVKFNDYNNGYAAKDSEIRSFISGQAPYEDNFMSTLTWNPILGSTNTTIEYFPTSPDHNVLITTKASEAPDKDIHVYFRLPYNYDSINVVEGTGLDAKPETSGENEGKILQKAASNYRVTTQYGMWFTKNNSSDKNTAKWVQAPAEIYDSSGNKLIFRHWSMKSVGAALESSEDVRRHDLKEEYEYKRCYNSEFNMTFYQDTYVEPIYISASDPDAALSPSEREAKDAGSILYGGAIINFMENSRNQWNNDGGNLYGSTYENISSRIGQGDRVFSDFLLSFNYLGKMLNSSLGKYIEVEAKDELGNVLKDEEGNTIYRKVFIPFKKGGSTINFKAGFVLEEVAEIEDTDGDGDLSDEIKSQAKYNALYNSAAEGDNPEAKTQMDSALAYIRSGTNPGGKFIVNDLFSATGLDNKNEIQYSTSLPIISHSSGAANLRKNKIYRAYAYLRDCTTGGSKSDYTWNDESISDEDFTALSGHSGRVLEISKPVYFTIYNIASVQNGTPFDDKGGQS